MRDRQKQITIGDEIAPRSYEVETHCGYSEDLLTATFVDFGIVIIMLYNKLFLFLSYLVYIMINNNNNFAIQKI